MPIAAAAESPVTAYARAVVEGHQVAGRLVRLAGERHLHDLATAGGRQLRFDEAAADRAIRFFPLLKHSKGEWARRPFVLAPWQAFIIGSLFGWQRSYGQCAGCEQWLPVGTGGEIDCLACEVTGPPAEAGWLRRFRTAYIELARKNGKSTLGAGVGNLLAFFDNEPGAEVYAAATKRDQAMIVWSEARRMVRATPALRKRIRAFVGNLSAEELAQKFEPLGADADNLDGLNVHGAIVDELHAHKTRALLDILDTATGSRRQPLIFIITTAGYDRESVCWEQHSYGAGVNEGTVDDDAHFAYIAALDADDDWRDPAVWIKANPNLGVSVKVEDLRHQVERAAQLPGQQSAILRLRCNVWTQQSNRAISLDLWDANAGKTPAESDLAGRVCYGGLDLGEVDDLTCWALAFPREDDPTEFDVLVRSWCPEAKLTDPHNRYADQYRVWKRQGWLQTTPGPSIDSDFVEAQVLADAEKFGLVELNIDRAFEGRRLGNRLAEQGLAVFGMGQGFLSMGPAYRDFQQALLDRKLHHGGNPVLRWMAANVAVRQDPAGNLKPDKAASQGKIDGIVALIMALDRAMRHQEQQVTWASV